MMKIKQKSIETSRSHSFGSSESDHPNTVTHRQIALNKIKVAKAAQKTNSKKESFGDPVQFNSSQFLQLEPFAKA